MSLVPRRCRHFVREANQITEVKELRDSLLDRLVPFRRSGFDYFARNSSIHVEHHADQWRRGLSVRFPGSLDGPDRPQGLFFRRSRARRLPEIGGALCLAGCAEDGSGHADEPAARRDSGFGEDWPASAAGSRFRSTSPGANIPASCSFSSTRTAREIPKSTIPCPPRNYVGCFAFEAARRVCCSACHAKGKKDTTCAAAPSSRPSSPPRRQLDCVVLARPGQERSRRRAGSSGSSDHETAHQHMEAAKRKYEVATRMQLVVRALFDSQLAFADLVN